MDSKHESYQRTAEHCLQMALDSPGNEHRVAWLTLAHGWLQLIPPDQIKIGILPSAMRSKAKH